MARRGMAPRHASMLMTMTDASGAMAGRWWSVDEDEFSAALAVMNSVKPRNEMEAMLAAQMAAIHMLTMKVAARVVQRSRSSLVVI